MKKIIIGLVIIVIMGVGYSAYKGHESSTRKIQNSEDPGF